VKEGEYPAEKLVIDIIGEEKSRWTVIGYIGEAGARVPMKRVGREVFLKQSDTLHTFEDKLVKPGHYKFPFTLTIPDWVPSSLVYCGDFKSKVRVFYTIKVSIADCTVAQAGATLMPSIKGKRRVLVSQPKCDHIDNFTVDVGHKIKWFGVFNEGEAEAHATFLHNVFN